MTIITETDFVERLRETLSDPVYATAESVTGPGRSGCMAAIYASHLLGIDFVPFRSEPHKTGPLIIIDIAATTMRPIEKISRRYEHYKVIQCLLFHVEAHHHLWFELNRPSIQIFRREEAGCRHTPGQHYCQECGPL